MKTGKSAGTEFRIVCPCCKTSRSLREVSMVLAKVAPRVRDDEEPVDLLRGTEWGCDHCLSSGLAVMAKSDCHHLGRCGCPSWILSYYDQARKCARCSEPFVFTKEEQRYWYEELNFYMASVPNECAPCRRLIRQEHSGTRRLSVLIPRFKRGETELLETICDIYIEMGKTDRAMQFLAMARRDHAKSASVLKRIKTIKDRIKSKQSE